MRSCVRGFPTRSWHLHRFSERVLRRCVGDRGSVSRAVQDPVVSVYAYGTLHLGQRAFRDTLYTDTTIEREQIINSVKNIVSIFFIRCSHQNLRKIFMVF